MKDAATAAQGAPLEPTNFSGSLPSGQGAIWEQQNGNIHAGHQKYRPDIDGMRALSIGLVVGFHYFPTMSHFFFPIFRGGFIGVDVFFVISGFLITSIIFSEIHDGRFTFRRFYARRIRRIFPALAVVLFAVCCAGAVLLLTNEFQDLGKYVVASAGFVANIALLNGISYFDNNSDLKPLLHMWSLGIEEQFYIFWPPFLLLATKLRLRMRYLLLGTFLLSFAANLYLMKQDVSTAFYIPFSRFFELIGGAAIAYFTIYRRKTDTDGVILSQGQGSLVSALGVGLILAADVLLSTESKFPGWWALMPVAGGMMLIIGGPKAWVNRTILAHPFMVFVGTISYPLYLWHWPLLSLLNITNPTPPLWQKVALAGISVLLAWLTYRLIEHPLRFNKSRLVVPFLCAIVAVIGLAGATVYLDPAFQLRGDPRDTAQLKWPASQKSCYKALGVSDLANSGNELFCYVSAGQNHSVALLGDSMANALYPGMRDAFFTQGVVNYGNSSCAPFRGLYGTFSWNRDCHDLNEKIYRAVAEDSQIKTVVLVFASWDLPNMNFDPSSTPLPVDRKEALMAKNAQRDLDYWTEHGKHIIMVFDAPLFREGPRKCIASGMDCVLPASQSDEQTKPYIAFWSRLAASRTDVCVFSQNRIVHSKNGYPLRFNGTLAYRDDHHLSDFGSHVVASALAKSGCFSGS